MQNYYLTRRLTFEEINTHYKDDNEIINMALYNTLDHTKIKKLLHTKTSCIKKDLTKLNQELLKENINTKNRLIILNNYAIKKSVQLGSKYGIKIKNNDNFNNKIVLDHKIIIKKELNY